MHDTAVLLRATRGLSAVAATFLAVGLFGNLYEEIVSNTASIAHPHVGTLVSELAPGSPLYYYLPWAPLASSWSPCSRPGYHGWAPRHG